jgi:WD40 repeat protein
VRLIDLATGRIRLALGSHDGAVIAARFTADGRRLLTSGEDSTAIVWDVGRVAAEERFTGHAGRLGALAIAPGDATAYTASVDGSLISWDLTGTRGFGQAFRAGAKFDGTPAVSISPDGRLLATAGRDGTVSLVDTRTLQRRTLAVLGDAPPYGPLQPTFSSNSTLVVTGRHGLVERVDLRTGRITDRLPGHQVDVFAPVVSRNGRVLVAGAGDGLRVWDLRTLRPLGGPITLWTPGSYAVDPRASRLAATVGSGSTIDLLDRSTHRRLARLTVDGSDIEASAFSPDGRLLAAASHDGRVQIFSVSRRAATAPAFDALAGAVASVAFSPDGKTLVATGQNGQIRLWDVGTREPIGAPLPAPEGVGVTAVFTPDGRSLLAVFSNGSGARWDVNPASWEHRACAIAGRRLTRFEWQQLLAGRPYAPAC